MGISNPVHLMFVAAVALLVLGPKRLPELARALGKGIQEFRDSMSQAANPDEPSLTTAPQILPPEDATAAQPEEASFGHSVSGQQSPDDQSRQI